MIITRTPFRITLGGGGTDLPFFYEEHGGFVLSMAIDKYMFICLNRRSVATPQIVVRYSQVEVVDSIDEIKHPLAREALRLYGVNDHIELTSIADLPGNTGLGSSGSYLVGLLTALRVYTGATASPLIAAEDACRIEMDILKEPVGKQDQYIAALGGFQALEVARDGRVRATALEIDPELAGELASTARIYYTGVLRSATAILGRQRDQARGTDIDQRSRLVDGLLAIREIGRDILEAFKNRDLDRFAVLMDAHWQHKRRLGDQVSLGTVDLLYDEVKKRFGVLGGKIIGAGGGGFLMLYCPKHAKDLDQYMAEQGMPQVSYRPAYQGASVVVGDHLASGIPDQPMQCK